MWKKQVLQDPSYVEDVEDACCCCILKLLKLHVKLQPFHLQWVPKIKSFGVWSFLILPSPHKGNWKFSLSLSL